MNHFHLLAPGKPGCAVSLWLAVAEEGEEHLTVGFGLNPEEDGSWRDAQLENCHC